jgi:3,5-epimerase/4-reductase
MTALVYGQGWIGHLLLPYLREVGLSPAFATARADNAGKVRDELAEVQPLLVFAAVGRTHGDGINSIDYLEGRLQENLRDNLVAPLILADECSRAKIPFACIATGCIFEGDGFAEADRPNFFGSSYSCVKGATDQLLGALFAQTALWFRIRMPITHDRHPRSFLTKILRYEKICSHTNSMSVLDGPRGLLGLFVRMAIAGYTGCYNGCNPGALSHNEILEMYRALVDPTWTWQNFSREEQAEVLRAGRSTNTLDSSRLEAAAAALRYPLPDLRAAVTTVCQALRTESTSRN